MLSVRSLFVVVVASSSLLVLAGAAGGAAPNGPSPNLVISQIYGGGGNSGAVYSHDYIEIFNRSATSVSLAGKSLQYASASGTGNFGANPGQLTELAGSLGPGQYLLVREATNNATVGAPLPTPYLDDPTPINMSGTSGKVALVEGTATLGCNTAATCLTNGNDTRIIDLVGYGAANYFEGAAPTLPTSNTTAAFRNVGGCQDSDNNGGDFTIASPSPRTAESPRNFCSADSAPFVASTTPSNGATEVANDSNITVTFSEPVNAAAGAFALTCTRSGSVTLTVTPGGASTSYVLDPQRDLQQNETCTVTVEADVVTDVDEVDPPNNMAADYSFSFSTTGLALRIHDIQDHAHISPYDGALVSRVPGVVTATSTTGFWFQDPQPDMDVRTSEGIFVFTGGPPTVVVGTEVRVSGRVSEFRAGCFPTCAPTSSAFANLTTTEIVSPTAVPVGPGPAIAPTIVGLRGRIPPTRVIENDSAGNVETSNTFDVKRDGIDFYESLEGMYVRIRNAVATGPRNNFGEISVLGDYGRLASVRTSRGGIVVRRIGDYTYQQGDFNPERMILDDVIRPTPVVDVRDGFTTPVEAVVDYGFGNFKFLVLNDLVPVDGGLQREFARAAKRNELVVATYNVENLDPTDAASGRFQRVAEQIVQHMKSPDLINVEEIQDNDGATSPAPTDASVTWRLLIAAIQAAGGPLYDYRQIDPLPNTDGGEPNGNIRVGFLFRTDRGLTFVDRPGGTAVTPNQVVDTPRGAELLYSPGRVDPNNPAFASSRKPLAGEFEYGGQKLFVIGNHFNSKGGDDPLFGRFQPPNRRSEVQRHQQAAIVNDFVDRILAADRKARVIVLGDLNDFQFSKTMDIVEGRVLRNLFDKLPLRERYTYVFDGNSQALDHVLVTRNLFGRTKLYDVVHMNSEFADQLSDHDPPLAYLSLGGHGGDDDDDDDDHDDDDDDHDDDDD
jgi:predicted extracellular nuclease